jgi:hypothetical protein
MARSPDTKSVEADPVQKVTISRVADELQTGFYYDPRQKAGSAEAVSHVRFVSVLQPIKRTFLLT